MSEFLEPLCRTDGSTPWHGKGREDLQHDHGRGINCRAGEKNLHGNLHYMYGSCDKAECMGVLLQENRKGSETERVRKSQNRKESENVKTGKYQKMSKLDTVKN